MSNYKKFINAIYEKRILSVEFNSQEKGIITRTCIPFDYGPSRKYKDNSDRYHFYDLDSPQGRHNLSICPNQIINIESIDDFFKPSNYITWKPNWIIKRDWGVYS